MCCENSICSLKVSIIVIIYPYVSFVFASGCKLYGFILNIAYIVRLYPLAHVRFLVSEFYLLFCVVVCIYTNNGFRNDMVK